MKFLIVSALLSAALLVASSPVDSDLERTKTAKWESFKAAHGKEYSPGEELVRKAQFLAVDAMIQANNQNPNSTYKMAHNRLSDLSEAEKKKLLGFTAPTVRDVSAFADDPEEILAEFERAPTSLDYRTSKCVGPVKHQGRCGSCWAFSAIAPIEYQYCMSHGKTYLSLSEQQLLDCDKSDSGCNGGLMHWAWSYLKSAGGVLASSDYAYKAKAGTCAFSASKVKAKIVSYAKIPPGSVSAIVAALNKYGPVSVAFAVTNNFWNYKSGVFSDPSCTCTSTSCDAHHAVTNVGYGTDSASGKDYWIVRNSWGSGWGNKGYFLIEKGSKMCGIENYACYVEAK